MMSYLAENLPYAFSYLMVLIAIMVLCAALYVGAAAYEYVARVALRFASCKQQRCRVKQSSQSGDSDGV